MQTKKACLREEKNHHQICRPGMVQQWDPQQPWALDHQIGDVDMGLLYLRRPLEKCIELWSVTQRISGLHTLDK